MMNRKCNRITELRNYLQTYEVIYLIRYTAFIYLLLSQQGKYPRAAHSAVECSRKGMEDNQSQNGRITAGCIPGPGGDISSDNLQSFV